ncbi:MazG nucleotide pyrophosphohydrolase domain-containing protein [Herpetosiphon llansteffanensis]|uniref:MazG nucleotide pyrophosphohydrolase domain-containing protein n=1 Tax=Herpetosiphon llansteffanensis TaxID=2094568 RepID=UPI000D7C569D|nr:MazG nucleotide pyrophosphohydrolase domain-containing protein [Herpetosiphon llansteffanensis]
MPDHSAAVRAFHEAIGMELPDTPQLPSVAVQALRQTLLQEEYTELQAAIAAGDLVAIAQEAADLLYVTYGLCLAYGIELNAVFAEVHRANLAKTTGPRRADGKQLKPADWQPPDVASVLVQQSKASFDV